MQIYRETPIRKVNQRKTERRRNKKSYHIINHSQKTTKEYSAWSGYYLSKDDKVLKYLLDMNNKIWEEGEIPNTWKHATITPLLKEGIGQKDVRSYRPVALTNIL